MEIFKPELKKMDAIPKNDRAAERQQLEKTFDQLWPICRSITGKGLRRSFKILSELIPLTLHEVATGTQVFDWQVPREWNINDAYIITPEGEKIASFKKNNLHILNYSIPMNESMEFEQLESHLHYLDELPEAIPYRTSYYSENWGFCLSKEQFQTLPKQGQYQVTIDSSLTLGALTYGDLVLPGESDIEILFTSYLCHPSLANNELSGPLVLAGLAKRLLAKKNRRYTYRFVIAPETIGAIAYLSKNGEQLQQKLKAGYVVTCAGDSGGFTYKRSRRKTSYADRVAEYVLAHQKVASKVIDFSPLGSDERQYCSSGFNLPVGSLMRTMYGEYPEYHTSLDNKELISFKAIQQTIDVYEEISNIMENDLTYQSTQPYCEPQLGKRGLYRSIGDGNIEDSLKAIMWILNYSDSQHSLLDITCLSNLPFSLLVMAARKLENSKLLEKVSKSNDESIC